MTATTETPPPSRIEVTVKKGRDKALRQDHPWLFSGAIDRQRGPSNAALATVLAANGKELGTGLWNPKSQIRVRMLHRGPAQVIDTRFFAKRIERAMALREATVPADTNGYRLLNAEGDELPGWTIDRFGDLLVSQVTAAGLDQLQEPAFEALHAAVPDLDIFQLNSVRIRRHEGLSEDDVWLRGEPRTHAPFTEHGLRFTAELGSGQKTGFYLDQRDNRRQAERLAGDREVLDLFAHTGAFSLYALRGGASQVTAVESSARLVERGQADATANGLPTDRLNWTKANVFEDLRQRQERYGLVICDPPSLVARRSDLNAGARAYKDLNRLAFQRTATGGYLMTFSCSAGVDPKLFRQILFAAATEAGVRASLLRPLAAAPDHPVSISHLQGEYLKGWLVHVSSR